MKTFISQIVAQNWIISQFPLVVAFFFYFDELTQSLNDPQMLPAFYFLKLLYQNQDFKSFVGLDKSSFFQVFFDYLIN